MPTSGFESFSTARSQPLNSLAQGWPGRCPGPCLTARRRKRGCLCRRVASKAFRPLGPTNGPRTPTLLRAGLQRRGGTRVAGPRIDQAAERASKYHSPAPASFAAQPQVGGLPRLDLDQIGNSHGSAPDIQGQGAESWQRAPERSRRRQRTLSVDLKAQRAVGGRRWSAALGCKVFVGRNCALRRRSLDIPTVARSLRRDPRLGRAIRMDFGY